MTRHVGPYTKCTIHTHTHPPITLRLITATNTRCCVSVHIQTSIILPSSLMSTTTTMASSWWLGWWQAVGSNIISHECVTAAQMNDITHTHTHTHFMNDYQSCQSIYDVSSVGLSSIVVTAAATNCRVVYDLCRLNPQPFILATCHPLPDTVYMLGVNHFEWIRQEITRFPWSPFSVSISDFSRWLNSPLIHSVDDYCV